VGDALKKTWPRPFNPESREGSRKKRKLPWEPLEVLRNHVGEIHRRRDPTKKKNI